MTHDPSYTVQRGLLIALTIVFFITVVQYLRGAEIILGVVALVLMPTAHVLAKQLGPIGTSSELVVVMFVAFLAYTMPLAVNAPISGMGITTAVLGILITEGFWAIHRYPSTPSSSDLTLVRAIGKCVRWGLASALAYSVIAAVIVASAESGSFGTEPDVASTFGVIIIGYFVGGVGAGFVTGAMYKFWRHPLGVMLTGIIAGAVVFGAMVPLIGIVEVWEGSRNPMTLGEGISAVLLGGLLLGPPAALSLRAQFGYAAT